MKKSDHQKHERLAVAGFVISLVLAVAAFYYIYQVQVNYGRTIEGLRDYACVQWQHENCADNEPNCDCPEFDLQIPEKKMCCCDLPGEGRFSKYGIYTDVPLGADEITYASRCATGCDKGGARLLNTGRCRWIDVS